MVAAVASVALIGLRISPAFEVESIHVDPAHLEIELARLDDVRYQPANHRSFRIHAVVAVVVPVGDGESARRSIERRRFRLQETLSRAVRQAPWPVFFEPSLSQLKRRIRGEVVTLLGDVSLESVVLSELAVTPEAPGG